MLEFEDENRRMLADKFGPQLDCARDLLAVGQQVAAAISPNELRELLREYRRLSRDTSGSAGDLRHARLRAKALDSAVKQYP